MMKQLFCLALILCVAASAVSAASMRQDSSTGQRPYFGENSYLVHLIQSGTTQIGSTVCQGRPDGSIIMVDNVAAGGDGDARDPTLVLCNQDAAFPLGANARPQFVLLEIAAASVSYQPAGYRRANVFEAAMWLRSTGQAYSAGRGESLSVAVDGFGPACSTACSDVSDDDTPVELALFANADDETGRIFWHTATNVNQAQFTLFISQSSPVQFASPEWEGEEACASTDMSATAQNWANSTNAQKDSYCAEQFGDSYRAAYEATVFEQLKGGFSHEFVLKYLLNRRDLNNGTLQSNSPWAFFTTAQETTAFDNEYSEVLIVPTFEGDESDFASPDFGHGDCGGSCGVELRDGINFILPDGISCDTGCERNCIQDRNLYVACERIDVISAST